MRNGDTYFPMIVLSLTGIGVIALIGVIMLLSLGRSTPDQLVNITFTVVGALGGSLTQPRRSVRASDIPQHAAVEVPAGSIHPSSATVEVSE